MLNPSSKLAFLLAFVILGTNVLGNPLEKDEFDEDSTVLVDPDVDTTTIGAPAVTTMSQNVTEPVKCADRYKVCRTFGPLPLPCCGDFVCKVTYGEMHCVGHSFSAS